MNDWLDKEDFVPFASENLGEEVHVHHCKQGRNNDRLYIKRETNGDIIAYCHHCGARGIHRESGTRNIHTKRLLSHHEAKDSSGALALPKDIEFNINKWPVDARVWPMKYGITEDELNANRVGYSERSGGIVLPTFDAKGILSAFSVRFDKNGIERFKKYTGRSPAKYRTYRAKNVTGFNRLFVADKAHGTSIIGSKLVAVLVEDVLSAIKVSRIAEGIALQGTGIDDEAVFTLAKKYDIIFIWLDNDNNQVKKSQSKLIKRLQLYNRNINIIYTDRDPKEFTTKEIENILINASKRLK